MEPSVNDKIPGRSNKDYLNNKRSVLTNHLRTEIAKDKGGSRLSKMSDFLSKRIWSWIYNYFKSRFGPKAKYRHYRNGDTGIYRLTKSAGSTNEYTSIAIASDWATDTAESFGIGQQIKKHNPDYTIHVGDTYFVGAPHEIRKNFVYHDSPWIRGNTGSFAVLGNHEMYARGEPFFKYLLPTLGIKAISGKYDGQKAGFFCLENDHWRILGLDTGYHSIGKPIIELLPFLGPKAQFDKILLSWLEEIVKLGDPNDKRGLVILTHHQYFTAFKNESDYPAAANQLADIIKQRKVIWLWGHEHKLSLFEKAEIRDGLFVYGRCIGHGGTPVEIQSRSFITSSRKNGFKKLVMFDKRQEKEIDGTPLGHNGYALLKIRDSELTIEYYDERHYLFSEKWMADVTSGDIEGRIDVPADCPLNPEAGKTWKDGCKA